MNDRNQITHDMNDELEPQLESAVWAVLTDPLPQDAIGRVRTRALALETEQISVVLKSSPKSAWRASWSRLAVLAACLLLVIGTMALMPSSDVLAQVVEQIKKVSTARYVAEETGPRGIVAIARVQAPHRLRLDFENETRSVSVNNGSTGEVFSYDVKSNEVHVYVVPIAKTNFDILQLLTQPDFNAVKSKDTNSIAGTQLFDIFGGKGRIWIDTQTNLPVRIEMPSPTQGGTTKRIYRDFEWNIALDDNLFAFPADKRIVRSAILATPTEMELVAAFAIRQAFSQEPYDASFLDKRNKPGLKLGQLAYDLTKGPAENFQLQSTKLQDYYTEIGISETEAKDPALLQKRIDYLCMKLDDWANTIAFKGGWVGTGVLPGVEKPLCWWRVGDRVRVLRGNLKIVDADQPPSNP